MLKEWWEWDNKVLLNIHYFFYRALQVIRVFISGMADIFYWFPVIFNLSYWDSENFLGMFIHYLNKQEKIFDRCQIHDHKYDKRIVKILKECSSRLREDTVFVAEDVWDHRFCKCEPRKSEIISDLLNEDVEIRYCKHSARHETVQAREIRDILLWALKKYIGRVWC